jgi:hypothetical protein
LVSLIEEETKAGLFEKRVLWETFCPKKNAGIRGGREYSEDLHDLYSSPSIYRVIKPIRLRWMGNVAYIEKRGMEYRVLLDKPERKRPFGKSKL